ncbi:MAG: hypothetical protein P8Y58_11650 [Novosphingobium sp.]
MLRDGENLLFEAMTIIEYISHHHAAADMLIPSDADAAIGMRMLDRMFGNYVMEPMADVVSEHLHDSEYPDRGADSRSRRQAGPALYRPCFPPRAPDRD